MKFYAYFIILNTLPMAHQIDFIVATKMANKMSPH